MTFSESSLSFSFNEDWIVKPFDKHPFYQAISGRGFKGVDFIGIYKKETLVLIEVKNYHKRTISPVPPNITDILGEEPPLINTFIDKIDDTELLINTIFKYFQRKKRYPLYQFLWTFFPKELFLSKKWAFWTKVHELFEVGGSNLHFVLWLELEKEYDSFSEEKVTEMPSKLKQAFSAYFTKPCQIYIASIENNPYKETLLVDNNS